MKMKSESTKKKGKTEKENWKKKNQKKREI